MVIAVSAVGGEDVAVDSARQQDPRIELPSPRAVFSPKLKPLWLSALSAREEDLKRQAAQTIALAHRRGMPELADTAGPLMEALDAPDQHPAVMLAAARALIVLDARQAAPLLFKHAVEDGLDMSQLVEPALAAWDFQPIRKVWLDRLSSAGRAPPGHRAKHGRGGRRRPLVLAIRGVADVGAGEAEPRLLELARGQEVAPDIRLEAARALGKLRHEGLEQEARNLAGDKSSARIADRLVAASLLSGHLGDAAQALLLELAVDPEPAVAAVALGRLLEIDPMLVIPIAEKTIASDDANVRRLGARALVAWRTLDATRLLGPMLDDPHPEVRSYVRRSLLEMAADPPLAEAVLDEALKMLATEHWRGLEQAALMAVALEHKPAAGRLVELLEFERPEVFVTAAWALRRLAVPATLDAMFDKAKREIDRIEASKWGTYHLDRQLSQLLEAFGQMKYVPAEPLLRRHIPKNSPFGLGSRAASIWSLGHLHAGKPEPELARLLDERLSDINLMFPEAGEVRLMSAVTLGRMKAKTSLPTLQRFLEGETPNSPVGYACGWAIHQITGAPIPQPVVHEASQMGWFLEPLER
ncbi:MAG: hypothetical protein A2V98_01470 [Planctomycetes bacterium RBG_16_64_12]|nr:MAG: hypothetical protein A2V98_01470 [Planctomycetes bacterium RBG_16_64_12]